jgi:hypothetical protein
MRRQQRNAYGHIGAVTGLTMALAFGVVLVAVPASPQNRPPLTEPIALEGTMKAFYRGVNVVVVTTMDGVEHVYHFTKNLVVHGGKAPGADALARLDEGTPVVIHPMVNGEVASAEEIDVLGDEGLKITEGRVIHVDRQKKEITIRYGNGKTERLQLTAWAAAETATSVRVADQATTEFVIYYTDEEGHKVAHYVTKKR